ncbi:hypothetical protein ACRTDR_15175 [Shewanella algae]
MSGTTFSQFNDVGAYPDEAHRKAILNALANYFGMLGEALIRQSHRESNSGFDSSTEAKQKLPGL